MNKTLLATTGLGLCAGLAFGLGTGAATGLVGAHKSTTVTLCVNRSNGAVRVAGRCSHKEHALSINKQGRRGPAGPSTGKAGGALTGRYPHPTIRAAESVRKVAPAPPPEAGNACAASPVIVSTFCSGAGSSAWLNYGAYQVAGFWRDREGIIHLRGGVKSVQPNYGYDPGQTIFVLPPGYRPKAPEAFPVVDNTDALSNPSVTTAAVIVNPDGTVTTVNVLSPFISLSGIAFRTDQ